MDTAIDDSHVDHPENHVVGDPAMFIWNLQVISSIVLMILTRNLQKTMTNKKIHGSSVTPSPAPSFSCKPVTIQFGYILDWIAGQRTVYLQFTSI